MAEGSGSDKGSALLESLSPLGSYSPKRGDRGLSVCSPSILQRRTLRPREVG